MKHLYDPACVAEVQQRLTTLTPDRQPVWGKMNVGQAMAHLAVGLESASGERVVKRVPIGYILGPIFKPMVVGDDKPLKPNSPTAKEFLVPADCDFESGRVRVAQLIDRFAAAGEAGCTERPHAFFGTMTPPEWSVLMYKHLDHHLRQFGA